MWTQVPLNDAGQSRDISVIPRLIPFWALAELISYLGTLAKPDFFNGTESQVNEAIYDTEEALALLMEDSVSLGGYMVGDIVMHVMNELPATRLICDGATYNRVDYPDLYDAIDEAYHVNADSFTVPDLRDRFIKGEHASQAVKTTGGAKTHTLTINEMPSHNHSVTGYAAGSYGQPPYLGGDSDSANWQTSNAGGGQAHNNEPQYYVLRFAIVAANA